MNNKSTHSSIARSGSSTGRHPRPQRTRRGNNQKRAAHFRTELSAGGIIYRRRGGHVEIFFIKDPYNRWTFPKGHQENKETLEETAVREIQEETGLENLKFIAPIGRTLFRFRREGTIIEKTVHFFLFEASPEAKEIMTGEGAIWEATWVKAHKAFSTSGYRNLDRLLSKALRLISHEERQRKGIGMKPSLRSRRA